jgi:hypothetical protein
MKPEAFQRLVGHLGGQAQLLEELSLKLPDNTDVWLTAHSKLEVAVQALIDLRDAIQDVSETA